MSPTGRRSRHAAHRRGGRRDLVDDDLKAATAARRHLLLRPQSAAVTELVRLCGRRASGAGIGAERRQFPPRRPLYQGNHWNHPFQNRALAEADFILVVDSDVPWIPTVNKPSGDAAICHHRCRSAEAIDAALVHQGAANVFGPMRRLRSPQFNASLDRAEIDRVRQPSAAAPLRAPHRER